MTQKPNIQYIHYYTQGSAAQKVTPEAFPSKVFDTPKTRRRSRSRKVIYLDPVAVLGLVVAGVMLIFMMLGVYKLRQSGQQAVQMEQYVQQLSQEQEQLTQQFEDGYDLQQIEQAARDMGMIPKEQAPHLEVSVEMPQQQVEPTIWEQFTTFLSGLFA